MISSFYQYLPDGVSFFSQEALRLRKIYFPLCGPTASSLKSAMTPFLSGDIKIDKNRFLAKPVTREDLHGDVRNFFVLIQRKGVFSLAQETRPNSAYVEIGPLWHKLTRRHVSIGLEMNALNFIPTTGENVELMRVELKNFSSRNLEIIPTFSFPIFGRTLANKHDHEHVTALLHRIWQMPQGVLLKPAMIFDERGHQLNRTVYFVFGVEDSGAFPEGSFPTLESFLGESGTLSFPEAVLCNKRPMLLPKESLNGKEAVGALRFKKVILNPGQKKSYLILMGMADSIEEAKMIFKKFQKSLQFKEAFEKNKKFWFQKIQSIEFKKGDPEFNSWVKWVALQPVFRRIYGCSFLPDHDYGKGGKGWRDIWQDLLSLILIEPEDVRADLVNNLAGVRIDGSNATIIGAKPGDFVADRNNITRVWMDHGLWPLVAILLYIHQTGDFDILFENVPYFRDPQLSRTFEKDLEWTPEYGNELKAKSGRIYRGTILEHILVEHLVQFFNVGEHNLIRLEGADWNDGLDMAFDRGESVAFSSFYAGNLLELADLLEETAKRKRNHKLLLFKELKILLDTIGRRQCNYDNPQQKRKLLFEQYFKAVQPQITGNQVNIKIEDLTRDLRRKGKWLIEHLRKKEMVNIREGKNFYSWFNGYYDNRGKKVEGKRNKSVRMTLTGQVFPILSGVAKDEDIKAIVRGVNYFLKDHQSGGLHLNTDFGLDHYLDLGRAFGFAYGTKENGAFFSHMNVMYAYALYKRGFVRAGWEVFDNLYKMCIDPERSKIYPGIPEYFDLEGRGMYPYLTGSASWFILTQLTQILGVRGQYGDLILRPQLVKEEFGQEGIVDLRCQFAGKRLAVRYVNKNFLDFGKYKIRKVFLNGNQLEVREDEGSQVKVPRAMIQKSSSSQCQLSIELG